MTPYRLFLSHGGDDTWVVERGIKPQPETPGLSVFLDARQIQYGDDFREKILAELAQCDELVVLFTRSALRRPWVLADVGATLVRTKRIVAFRYGPTEAELQDLGVLSLLGSKSLLKLDDFDAYVHQLHARVKAHNDG